MSYLNNLNNVAFTSQKPVDKIVRIFTGSYNRATDVITRSYTLSGAPWNAYFYRIPHGLPRPVTCEMMASDDGGATFVDGGIDRIAVSDSTYIYIFDAAGAPGAGTVQYKVWCSWIDDYDATNPFIDTVTYGDNPTQFDSRENYQKIADQNVLTFSPGTFGATETRTVIHSLNYSPNAKVYYEAFAGEVWPLNSGQSIFLVDDAQDEAELRSYTDRIEVTVNRYSNASKRAWYRIYYDQD